MTANTITPVSFDNAALAIVRTMDKADKAYVKATAEVARIMQQFIDQWFITNGKA